MKIYWCEFPDKVDWKKLVSWLNENKIVVYIAVRNRTEYEDWKKKIGSYSKQIEVNAWPTLSKKNGYWFSGFSSRESIDELDQYRGLNIKIDIEPPMPKKYSFFSAMNWLVFNLFRKAENSQYLREKIIILSEDTDIILSTFPLPRFFLKRWGLAHNDKLKYNYMHYSSFMIPGEKFLYNIYYRFFVKGKLNDYFAVGLVGTGIFGNETVYKNVKDMEKDVQFLRKLGVNNFVFFEIGAIVERGKEWFDASIKF